MDDNKFSKTIGDDKVFVTIEPSQDLARIQRLDTPEGQPQAIMFKLEADYYQDEFGWTEGFSKRVTEAGLVIQRGTDRVDLSHNEKDQLERFFMQYRNGILV